MTKEKEEKVEPGKVAHRTTVHDRKYSLYVPSKYSKKKSWPLVFSSHGRGGEGAREIRPWQALANKHGFIVACPDMVTATNHRPKTSDLSAADEDDAVLMAIYDEVCARFRVNTRAVMITGFSGGGNPSYHTGLRHPDRITHICTRGGNFAPQQIPTDAKVIAAGKDRLRIYIFYGEKDHPLIVGEGGQPGQAKAAHTALGAAGYAHVEIEEIKAMKHESRPHVAATWFATWVAANAKRFKAGDKADALHAKAEKAKAKGKLPDAIKHWQKAADIETDAGLEPRAQQVLDSTEAAARAEMRKAEAGAEDEGGLDDALKALRAIARRYRGLPVAKAAAARVKTLKAGD